MTLIFGIIWAFSGKKSKQESSAPETMAAASRPSSTKLATPITADQAKDHLGEYCLVTMTVKRVGKSQSRYFLNHMEEYKHPDCFTVTFEKPVYDQLKQRGMGEVDAYFTNKVIRVRGTVTKFKNPRDGSVSIQIDVEDVNQITMQ